MDWKSRVRSAFATSPQLPDDDVIEELAEHARAMYEAARADGCSHDEADRSVTAQLDRWRLDGTALRRASRRPPALEPLPSSPSSHFAGIWQEIRHACRLLARSPGFTAIVALSVALGIGVNSTMFSFHDAILLRPLNVRDPASIVTVSVAAADALPGELSQRGPGRARISYPNYRDLRERSQSFDGLVASQSMMFSFARTRQAAREMRAGVLISENFFSVLGIRPGLGRGFTGDEGTVSGRDTIVVLGYDFWKNVLGADPSILNETITINGIDCSVIGVMPESFTGLDQFFRPALYLPLTMSQRLAGVPANPLEDRLAGVLEIKGRLKSSVSRSSAEAELVSLWKELARQYPDANRNRVIAVRTELQERIYTNPPNAIISALMTVLAALVLVIACANVANLMLGRARARSREMAIRLALGVSRTRLLRQLLTESLLLGLLGGALGVAFAYGGIQFMAYGAQMVVPTDLPFIISPQLDSRVLLFSLIAALASAVLFGLAPAWQCVKTDLVPALKSSDVGETMRQRTIGRNVLVVTQVALSMVLLVATGMVQAGFRNTLTIDPGFRTDHLMTLTLDTSFTRYTPEQTHNFYRTLVDRARTLQGVRSAALSDAVPLDRGFVTAVIPEGHRFPPGQESAPVSAGVVDDRYFSTMRSTIVRGRPFTADDTDRSRGVAIVNEIFATMYWPNEDPLGKRVRLAGADSPWLEVVGLAKPEKYSFIFEGPTPFLYLPFAQHERPQMSVLVETTDADASPLAAPLRELVRSLDVNQPVFALRTYSSYYRQRATGSQLLVMRVTTTMGLLGLTLALVGLYGLVTYSVTRRTREIGIRMAIGASRFDVLRMILRQGMVLAITGIVVGGAASVAAARLLTAGMSGLGAPNLTTYAVVPALLTCMTLTASYIPARRAAKVDPLRALRYE